eukprot:TRINITY_DN2862_c0_g1_i1.p1 TRINITY_DN2862_c0_g1~~TRINITY_DN2862_c0_g1_i1.p1  ORF type:complete len:353 (-),score=59.65 TRINITY_DN2862_c0_g1_i1:1100-2158(-)
MQNRGLKPPDEVLSCSSRPNPLLDRRLKPQAEHPQKCPRCESTNTKFCYYNNYSLSQPRYFCKTCRRYWTKGGTLRNVPVGGGCRKNKRAKRSVDQTTPPSDDHASPSANTAEGSNPSQSLESDQPGVSNPVYGYSLVGEADELSGYGFPGAAGSGRPSMAPALSSLSPLSALQSLKASFPAMDLQAGRGDLNMGDLSCIFDAQQISSSTSSALQQQMSEGVMASLPLDAYSAIDHQWQRLLQQHRGLEDGQVSMLPLDDTAVNGMGNLRNARQNQGQGQEISGKISEEEGRVQGAVAASTTQHWQLPQEGFYEGAADPNSTPAPFWNGGGVAGGTWSDISGFGPSSSGSLL